VLHSLQPVVNVQLWRHLDEAEGVNGTDQRVQHERIPALVLIVHHRVYSVANHQRDHRIRHVLHRDSVILLGLTLDVVLVIFELEVGELVYFLDLRGLLYLPEVKQD